ncbi:uncharacterized protein [Zea mays]|uniref:uncharacterized protein isoform X2 n=1 Tax=Zea mays TaxID=4577 RepID=UPI001652927F|nr:uncharacterized protein LOC111591133 isoform X2 [Zea mays]
MPLPPPGSPPPFPPPAQVLRYAQPPRPAASARGEPLPELARRGVIASDLLLPRSVGGRDFLGPRRSSLAVNGMGHLGVEAEKGDSDPLLLDLLRRPCLAPAQLLPKATSPCRANQSLLAGSGQLPAVTPAADLGKSDRSGELIDGDADDWEVVRPPYWWRKNKPRPCPSSNSSHEERRKKFLKHVEGKCCNCFATNHRALNCTNATKCWRCLLEGHQAASCPVLKGELGRTSSLPTPTSPTSPAAPFKSRSYVQVVKNPPLPMAAFPGDPLARPVRVDCAISASGAIEAARDELVGKTVVCSLEGNSHDSEPKHVEEALSERLGIRDRRFQVLKHFPEQYLIIFSSSHDQQLVLHRSRINHRGRVFTFEAWNEQRYGSVTRWGFHLRLRLEGIPVHAWNEKVAALIIGSHCATHFVEEESSFRRRTRTFDLWAWCSDPCLVPREAWLTITDPDSGVAVHPVRPVGIKHGLLYKVLIHMEVIEDLSFSLGGGGGPGRKRRRVMEWHYGVPDHLGERRERGRQLERGNRSWRQGGDDDDEQDGHGGRRHRSRSVWDRVSRCHGSINDCYSSSHRQGEWSRTPAQYHRQHAIHHLAWGQGAFMPNSKLVWRPKRLSNKKVSFAEPLVHFIEEKAAAHPSAIIKQDSQTARVAKPVQVLQSTQPMEDVASPTVSTGQLSAPPLEHFDRPLTKGKAEAIISLANLGTKETNKMKKSTRATVAPVDAVEFVA